MTSTDARSVCAGPVRAPPAREAGATADEKMELQGGLASCPRSLRLHRRSAPSVPLLGSELVLVEPAPFSHQPSCLPPRPVPFNLSLSDPGLSVGGQRAPWLEEPDLGARDRELLLVTCFF